MKDFSQYIKEEISIRGNKGIPQEKLRDIEQKGAQKIRGEDPRRLIPQIMRLVDQSSQFVQGNEERLEELAEKVIRKTFGIVLDNVDIDVKIQRNGNQIAEFMDQSDEEKKMSLPKLKKDNVKLTKDEIELAVHKRKIVNNIIQGEAKNTKHILHSDECKEGLEEIYGDRWLEIFNIWDETSKIADKLDWIIPIEHKASMMENQPGGIAGAVSVMLPNDDTMESDDDDDNDDIDIDGGGDSPPEIVRPVIMARGLDFPMLLHELVKGVYELISDPSMVSNQYLGDPKKSRKLATEIHKQTSSFLDEAEDFRYGPYLAKDLNDFVIKSPNIDKHPNIKEFVFGALIDPRRWTDEQILENLKNIFLETPKARELINQLVNETISILDKYKSDIIEWEMNSGDSSTDDQNNDEVTDTTKDKNYSDMSKSEIQSLIDDALDNEDYDKVRILSQYLKEGKEIYLKEIQRNEKRKEFHTRRK